MAVTAEESQARGTGLTPSHAGVQALVARAGASSHCRAILSWVAEVSVRFFPGSGQCLLITPSYLAWSLHVLGVPDVLLLL